MHRATVRRNQANDSLPRWMGLSERRGRVGKRDIIDGV